MSDDKNNVPEPCPCGCGGCEQQERFDEYIKRKTRETRENDANL